VPSTQAVLSDHEIEALVGDFVLAARLAQQAGYAFVDIKHCHGYLGHEFLSAVDRPGTLYGGSLENAHAIPPRDRGGHSFAGAGPAGWCAGQRRGLDPLSCRQADASANRSRWNEAVPYRHAFGGDGSGLGVDLAEPVPASRHAGGSRHSSGLRLGRQSLLQSASSSGRRFFFPPSDGYLPPRRPLARSVLPTGRDGAAQGASTGPGIVGSGYSYLQDWLPQVAQAVVHAGRADFVGLGRVALSYPELPADVLAGRPLRRKLVCRTFSDCTTAPRGGLVSGCYPLDSYYKSLPEAQELARLKSGDPDVSP